MKQPTYDVIIIGGSYSGLSAAMTLGRALRSVLVVDAGKPANRFTPESHNFITHDGRAPVEIAALAKAQVASYKSITFVTGFAATAQSHEGKFLITLLSGEEYKAKKLILATGIVDVMPAIAGFAECWGKSVLHCPYCHGYEIRNANTGILGNGDYAYEFAALISNWTPDVTIYTNGAQTFSEKQAYTLLRHNIRINDKLVHSISHHNGAVQLLHFKDGTSDPIEAIYARPQFVQHSGVADQLGCEFTEDGYIKTDVTQRTSVPGVLAIGDATTKIRTVSHAVSTGTIAGMTANKDMIHENFQ